MTEDSSSTLADSNILLDVLTDDAEWAAWSERQLLTVFKRGRVLINPIIC